MPIKSSVSVPLLKALVPDKKDPDMSAAAHYIYDNFFRKKVAVSAGAIVCCKLRFDLEHTGVYIGKNRLVELSSNGAIVELSPKDFLFKSLMREGLVIYTACDSKGIPLINPGIARRAKRMIGKRRNYHILNDNCHQFTAGCITGNFESDNKFFTKLEKLISVKLNAGKVIQWIPCEL